MIKDSYSEPHYSQYPWDTVEWGDPLPNDLVALHELYRAVQLEYFQHVIGLAQAGFAREDMPVASQYIWAGVAIKVGLAEEGSDLDPEVYEEMTHNANIGSYVQEDRMFQLMTDEELEEFMENREAMKQLVNDVMNDDETIGLIDDIIRRHEERKSEVEDLNKLFYEEQ